MRIQGRLQRLEQRLGGREEGCPVCRDRRGYSVLVTPRGETEAAPADWPAPCPRCGDIPEQIIEITEEVVETHEQATAPR